MGEVVLTYLATLEPRVLLLIVVVVVGGTSAHLRFDPEPKFTHSTVPLSPISPLLLWQV